MNTDENNKIIDRILEDFQGFKRWRVYTKHNGLFTFTTFKKGNVTIYRPSVISSYTIYVEEEEIGLNSGQENTLETLTGLNEKAAYKKKQNRLLKKVKL